MRKLLEGQQPRSRNIQAMVTQDEYDAIAQQAQTSGTSVSTMLRMIIREGLSARSARAVSCSRPRK